MTQTAVMRATSLLASGIMLGVGLIAALTMSVTLLPPPVVDDSHPFEIANPPPPSEPITHSNPAPPRDAIVFQDVLETINTIDLPPTTFDGVTIGPPEVQQITQPHWLRRPRDLYAYYPRRALQNEVEGDVVLDCLVSRLGALECAVVSETPAQWGFAAAALRIAGDHRMSPAMHDGVPVEGRYRMRVPFRVE